jgi:tRNA G46 methylase TrmB
VISLNRKFGFHIPLCYLFKKDYVLENADGIWNIKQGSDYDTLISPLFEPELRSEFCLEKPGYFIDIGAHIGKWSIFIARQNPENRVLSIDANKYTFSYLEKNIEVNALQKQITPVNI